MEVGDLLNESLLVQREAVRRRTASPTELMNATLDRVSQLEPTLGAFVTLTAESALKRASEAERALLRGEIWGPLHGIGYAVKDNIATRSFRTTAGSLVLKDWRPEKNATCVEQLNRAGGILVGKTELSEFACAIGNVRTANPWDTGRVAGPSSAGSAAAVASRMVPLALGTDTGGSIRIPASFCGIIGFKPTFGSVSTQGVIPVSWSLDHVGPFTRTVGDAVVALEALAGPGASGTRLTAASQRKLTRPRLGVVAESQLSDCDDEVLRLLFTGCDKVRDLGATVEEFELPSPSLPRDIWSVLSSSEAAAYHARVLRENPESFGGEVRRRLVLGMCTPASDYINAQRLRGEYSEIYREAASKFDAVLLPTVGFPAPKPAELEQSHFGTRLARHTLLANVLGIPALALPSGHTRDGMPIGIQLLGRPFEDYRLLAIGQLFEQALSPISSACGGER